ncbi:MBL fold metallo-hydrolase [Lutimaribacter sp. EGI FJ00015]|uniref:MBL fold metallo-hydrolase n=1 Tax=Lutimaribacter degradans TaxID=2945989 RepID=A0ACC5ZTH8_9RHOB|nr:MBL fold metallo-hydrolase [Lutimaribacter sp. EGI FJ00013]MCM2561346.1 MBL fold metallo-hydrolase [Lutimaribacter sp. EGI FJ00013]MCO0611703.1 MBL fold metallo-hydrolase [Lutimaribacter sp. EGI FJ00015]MCO0635175.1 MBL fold metallo-hydrolase [Lutimaribacter sp. EGI FJ00014]
MDLPEQFDPPIGVAERLAPGLRRIVAPNPSPMTWRGTNTYLVGDSAIAVIDPGPDDPAHLQAILSAIGPGQRITHILVTHAHLDHSPLARPLAQASGAPVLAYGDARAGRSRVMDMLAAQGLAGGGEGVDTAFTPDIMLADGDVVAGDGWQMRALWTPGHFGNHLSFIWGDAGFSGDLVMGWASSLVSPPDGDLTDFMTSCERLRAEGCAVLHAGHGSPVADPAARIDWLLGHRRMREAAILAALADGPTDPATLTRAIYTDTPAALLPAAERNVFAHLVDLVQKSAVTPAGPLSQKAVFTLNG